MKEILSQSAFKTQVEKLADSILKQHSNMADVVFIGVQQGGVVLADESIAVLKEQLPLQNINYGQLDITFYRDDIRNEILAPDVMHIPFSIENKTVILIDDVLFTGRTIKAALTIRVKTGRLMKRLAKLTCWLRLWLQPLPFPKNWIRPANLRRPAFQRS